MDLCELLRRSREPCGVYNILHVTIVLTVSKVTIAFATVRGFPWKKVPIYLLAQLLGALCGAGVVYATYFHAIDIVEGGSNIRTIAGSGNLFGTYAVSLDFLLA